MIGKKMLLTMYEYSYFLTNQAVDGISHQDSLVSPTVGDNPANWILGHIITSRSNVLVMLKIDPPWNFERCKPYLPESKPLSPSDVVEDFLAMVLAFEKTQIKLMAALQELTQEQLEESLGENTLGEELAGYAIHEAYHAGELAIIRGMIKPN
jgi:hypothetical protein